VGDGSAVRWYIRYLKVLKKICDLFRREVWCNILIEFSIPMRLFGGLNSRYLNIYLDALLP
jgi:hypothetical protein